MGSAVTTALLDKGFHVTGMVRRADSCLPKGVDRWVTPELPALAPDAVQRLSRFDIVVHTAGRAHILQDSAIDPLTDFRRVNTEGTLALARAAASRCSSIYLCQFNWCEW